MAKFGTNASDIYSAGEITQVKESIPWVRCASGNVWKPLRMELLLVLTNKEALGGY